MHVSHRHASRRRVFHRRGSHRHVSYGRTSPVDNFTKQFVCEVTLHANSLSPELALEIAPPIHPELITISQCVSIYSVQALHRQPRPERKTEGLGALIEPGPRVAGTVHILTHMIPTSLFQPTPQTNLVTSAAVQYDLQPRLFVGLAAAG
jgi:hypothetical protein